MKHKKIQSSGPGRPRKFEIDGAVLDAMEVFWARGYNAASLVSLIAGTGLSRGSLYKAFVDKHELFLAALDRYTTDALDRLRARLTTGTARDAIRAVLQHYARLSAATSGRKGCLVTAATNELLPEDIEVRQRVGRMFEEMQFLLVETIQRGQAEGEISSKRDPVALARFLLCIIQGMRVFGKTGPLERDMAEIAALAMEMLD